MKLRLTKYSKVGRNIRRKYDEKLTRSLTSSQVGGIRRGRSKDGTTEEDSENENSETGVEKRGEEARRGSQR